MSEILVGERLKARGPAHMTSDELPDGRVVALELLWGLGNVVPEAAALAGKAPRIGGPLTLRDTPV